MGDNNKENDYLLPLMQSKIDVQNQLLTLMQTQIDIHSDTILKQGSQIEKLETQLEELRQQLTKLTPTGTSEAPKAPGGDVATSSKSQSATSSGEATKEVSVAEMARQTAEATAANTGFLYDENSGLYYDCSSGLYYDPSQQLFYNSTTRTYYTYDQTTVQYVFHSQLPPEPEVSVKNRKSKRKASSKKKSSSKKRIKLESDGNGKSNTADGNEVEDGELSSSSENSVSIIERVGTCSSDSDASHGTIDIETDSSSEDDWDRPNQVRRRPKRNAPCIRAVVLESKSTVPKLKKGFLFIVTCMGGSIGREGSDHEILIPDSRVSKEHATITYEFDEVSVENPNDGAVSSRRKKYFITDLGSQNGTFLNGNRLSLANVKSEPTEITHGSILTILDTKILLHIHKGLQTCGHCEPGLILENEKEVEILDTVQNPAQRELGRKETLKKLRQKYGVGPQASNNHNLLGKYTDRAQDRRLVEGSDHPAFKLPEEEPASIHKPIDEQNKGFKMLQKMGWSTGATLGQTGEDGIREPIKIEFKFGRGGLGSGASGFDPNDLEPPPSHRGHSSKKKKSQILHKTAQRYFSASAQMAPLPSAPASALALPPIMQNFQNSTAGPVIDLD